MGPLRTEKLVTSYDEKEVVIHIWEKDKADVVFVIYHGFLAHAKYPTVRLAAEMLSQYGTVVAADMRGHGESIDGDDKEKKGYLPSASVVIQDGVDVAKYAQTKIAAKDSPASKLFLVGSSMGGTIALNVSLKMPVDTVQGVILLAPMLGLSVDALTRSLLFGLSYIIPDWQVIPSKSTSAEKQYRDPVLRKECEEDPYANTSGKIYVASAACCVDLAHSIQDSFSQVSVPYLLCLANEDVVVHNDEARDFHSQSRSKDKTLLEYSALHGLLCESEPLRTQIQNDIRHWVEKRI